MNINSSIQCININLPLNIGCMLKPFINYMIFCRTGDQILEYNGTDLRNATAEEAAYELAKPADKVTVVAQYNMDRK